MNKARFLIVFFLAAALTACAVGYQARGSLSDVAGELRGKGYPGNAGGGRFALQDRDGRLRCDGQAQLAEASVGQDTCEGEGGAGVLRCTDGRVIPFRWQAISCRSWRGAGVDAAGNRLEFSVERR